MTKSLSESAAEILKASMNAGKEPIQTLPAEMDDLGGTTDEKPEGDEVGKKAAATVKAATKPGQVSAEGDTKMNSVKSSGLSTPVVGNMNPSLGEETEETEETEEIEEEAEQIDEASLAKLAADHWKNHSAAAYGGNEGYSEKQLNRYRERADKILSDISQTHGADVAKAVKQHSSDAAEMENASAGNVDKNFHKNFANNVLGGVGSKNHEKYKSYVDKEGANHHLDEEVEHVDEGEKDEKEIEMKMKKEMVEKYRGSMREDVDALFNGESLSEDFRVKATTIFEAAVQSRVESIVEDVLSENDAVLIEAIEEIKNEMSAQVDEYLNYAVEEWVNENQVAIETGLRAELVEDFINGLKNLFTEHYIEIPEEKVDVAEELAMTVAQLEEAMTAAAAEKADLVEKLNVANKNEAIRKICEGLTEVQVGKMKSLAEGMEFTTEGDFNNKLAVIRENYFPSKKMTSEVKVLQETTVEEPEVVEASGMMKHYVNAITKTAFKA